MWGWRSQLLRYPVQAYYALKYPLAPRVAEAQRPHHYYCADTQEVEQRDRRELEELPEGRNQHYHAVGAEHRQAEDRRPPVAAQLVPSHPEWRRRLYEGN